MNRAPASDQTSVLTAPLRRTAAEEAESALLQGIMDGAITPGTPLRLQDLAAQLEMSMMPIREALRRLERLGLVEIVAHRGAWVRPLTRADLFDTYFTRMRLESTALLEAARRFDAECAAHARSLLSGKHAAEKRGDLMAARDLHERFHFSLYEASGSDWLMRSIHPLWRNSERYRVESMRNARHFRRNDAEHNLLIEALERHDGVGAVELIVSHLRRTVELIDASLPASEDEDGTTMTLPTAHDLIGR
ncbi:MAG TPA: GntR family transcriptional regulator [Solirubrobacteraceae bacterium]|nr:GntR family transcriptional regulator [Solirubrobacteraceae bacterium]